MPSLQDMNALRPRKPLYLSGGFVCVAIMTMPMCHLVCCADAVVNVRKVQGSLCARVSVAILAMLALWLESGRK